MQISSDILQHAWILAGPTAVGKTAVALELAERIGAEIVALDSMTLYRRMDIGTAKPTAEERARVPHHLLDVIEPHDEYSLAEYVSAAETACREILTRSRVPLFVGGTGLYLRGVLRGVFEGPAADWDFRRRWDSIATDQGDSALHARLAEVDPVSAARLHPNDRRRVIRALEVFELTGRPLSEQQEQPPRSPAERPARVYWFSAPREWLYERINRRVEAMFAAGLLDEVRALRAEPQGLGRTARQALGYKETLTHLEGRCSLPETVAAIQTRTRQFAKRQHTWFRNLEECVPFEISGEETAREIAERLAES